MDVGKKGWIFKVAKYRIPERDYGIIGEFEPPAYNVMQRYCRDKGWIPMKHILKHIQKGLVLEVGSGPGYLGLELLRQASETKLIGYDISEDMLKISRNNRKEYGLDERAEYIRGDVHSIAFKDGYFDAVISNDSFHEWTHPAVAFKEIFRVLKPGGRLLVSDLRRDMNPLLKGLIWFMCKPKALRPGWLTSINASYTISDIKKILLEAGIHDCTVSQGFMRFFIVCSKFY